MTLIRPKNLSPSEVIKLMELTETSPVPRSSWLGLAFFEPSTRTKLSFYAAARDVGYEVLDLPEGDASSLVKGETQDDTVRNMIEMLNLKTFVIRSKDGGLIGRMAEEYPEVRFLNAGNGKGHHPTQALGDLLTLADHFGGWKNLQGKRVSILGDVTASRVANSCREMFEMFGMEVASGGPDVLSPEWSGVRRHHSLAEALEWSDAVMTLRIQHERREGNSRGLIRQMLFWQINEGSLKGHENLPILHPGPVNRGVELTSDVADGMQSLILKQVRNGYKMRRALLQG